MIYNMMKLTIILLSSVLLAICSQTTEAKDYHRAQSLIETKLCQKYALAKSEKDLRGIKDVWDKIKEKAINSWNYIKDIAEQTKDKIKHWIENVKEHARELQRELEEKLQELRDKINNIIANVHETEEMVKQCIKREKENMEDILKQITKQMAQCIAEEISKLAMINDENSQLSLNDTKFAAEIDDKIEQCKEDMENVQECLCKVRGEVFDNLTEIENGILRNNFESKSIADDIKGTLVTCSIDNLIHATDLITTEVIEIAKCVIETKENEIESAE